MAVDDVIHDNRRNFADSNPVMLADPSGKSAESWINSAIKTPYAAYGLSAFHFLAGMGILALVQHAVQKGIQAYMAPCVAGVVASIAISAGLTAIAAYSDPRGGRKHWLQFSHSMESLGGGVGGVRPRCVCY